MTAVASTAGSVGFVYDICAPLHESWNSVSKLAGTGDDTRAALLKWQVRGYPACERGLLNRSDGRYSAQRAVLRCTGVRELQPARGAVPTAATSASVHRMADRK
ncbi:hypothetical protein O7626_04130 [Micromonospora sp. WMMD1102]|uniref:hypothetical protein n=1 Tax=Micromonospora sp. WMMD1102 TaxID=3016105 RepID=UPI002414DC85|nr:hypothetical protein [Micromonospora sp. WMMD1102]MDG4785127.1 hypothetical protein [Micromonospora sp. WMMD1102]